MDSFLRGAAAAAAQVRARVHHSSAEAPLLGKTLDVQTFRVKVERVLASGGFGFVYVVTDTATLAEYALKVRGERRLRCCLVSVRRAAPRALALTPPDSRA